MINSVQLESTFSGLVGQNPKVCVRLHEIAMLLQAPREEVAESLSAYRDLPKEERAYEISRGGFQSKTDAMDYEVDIQKRA
jgi:hypothetical protein